MHFQKKLDTVSQLQIYQSQQQQDENEMFENFKLKDFLTQINKFKEKDQPIVIPGFGYNSCAYAKLIEEERQVYNKNRKNSFTDKIFIEKQFLKSQSHARKAEHKLFEKLKSELEKQNQSDYDLLSHGFQEQLTPEKQNKKIDDQVSKPLKNILKQITDMNKKDLDQSMNQGKKAQFHKYSASNISTNQTIGGQQKNLSTYFGSGPKFSTNTAANNTFSGSSILGYSTNQQRENKLATGRAFFNFNQSLMKEGILSNRGFSQ